MAWAISAEVVLGAKREAQRRSGGEYHHDHHFKIPNVKKENFERKELLIFSHILFLFN